MTTRPDAQRLRLQELSHARTEVNTCECVCVSALFTVPLEQWECESHWEREGTSEGEPVCLFSASGSLDVDELFTRFCCVSILAAPNEVSDHAITHLGLLSAGRRRCDPPSKEQLGAFYFGPSQEVTLAPGPACVINIIAVLCPAACVTQGIIKVLI